MHVWSQQRNVRNVALCLFVLHKLKCYLSRKCLSKNDQLSFIKQPQYPPDNLAGQSIKCGRDNRSKQMTIYNDIKNKKHAYIQGWYHGAETTASLQESAPVLQPSRYDSPICAWGCLCVWGFAPKGVVQSDQILHVKLQWTWKQCLSLVYTKIPTAKT